MLQKDERPRTSREVRRSLRWESRGLGSTARNSNKTCSILLGPDDWDAMSDSRPIAGCLGRTAIGLGDKT